MNNVIIIIKDVIDINIKPIILDISKKNDDVLTTKKGDGRSRFLFFKLLDKSFPLDLTEKKLICYLVKPDSKKVLNYLVVNDAKKGYCTLELTNQVLAAAGVANLELMITKEDKKLTTIPLTLEVVKSLKAGFVESAHEFNALMDCLASVEKWDNEFADKIGKIEKLYTTRLNGIDASLEEITLLSSNFGIIGDGTDETYKINKALSSLKKGDTFKFTSTEKFYGLTSGITLINKEDINIISDGNVIKFLNGTSDIMYNTYPNYGKDSILRFIDCKNITIDGIVFNGNISNRLANQPTESFNSCISLLTCENININNCDITEGMTDGIFISHNASGDISRNISIYWIVKSFICLINT